LCIAFCVDGEEMQIWVPDEPVPPEFIAAANDANWQIVSHNDAFERTIAEYILGPRHDFPHIPIERRSRP
jgi:hypothetical protein